MHCTFIFMSKTNVWNVFCSASDTEYLLYWVLREPFVNSRCKMTLILDL